MGDVNRTTAIRPLEGLFALLVVALSVGLLATPYYYLSILPGLLLLAMFVFAGRPSWGYLLILFLIPFNAYTSLLEGRSFFTITKFVNAYLLIVLFFYFILHRLSLKTMKSPIWTYLVGFFLVSCVSVYWSEFRAAALPELRQVIYIGFFFAFTLAFVTPAVFCRALPRILIISITISSILGLVGFVFDLPFFIYYRPGYYTRATGATFGPNQFSLMIVFCLAILAHFFFSARKMSARVLYGALFLLNLVGLVATYSRSGALLFLVLLLLLVIEHKRRLRPRYVGFLLAGVLAMIIGVSTLVPASYWERQRTAVDTKTDYAVGQRLAYLKVGWEAFKKNPVIGSGPGTFSEIYQSTGYARKYQDDAGYLKRVAHNSFVEILVGTGTAGFLLYLAILVLTFRSFYQAQRNYREQQDEEMAAMVRTYMIAFIVLVCSFLVLSEVWYYKYLWAVIGISQISLHASTGSLPPQVE